MKGWILFLLTFFFVEFGNSQYKEKKIKLSNELNEISGIAMIGDSVYAVINDSGNEPKIYFLNQVGEIIHSTKITGATNVDWEEIVYQDSILYIADIGNNNSNRKDLCIYKVDIRNGWKHDNLASEKIEFSYAEQVDFPPKAGSVKFDSEAMYFSNGQLHLIAKSIEEPWVGTSRIYPVPIVNGRYQIQSNYSIFIPNKHWTEGAITGCATDDSTLTVLTYNKIILFDLEHPVSPKSTFKFDSLKQREGICYVDANTYYIVSERHKILGGPYLHILTRK